MAELDDDMSVFRDHEDAELDFGDLAPVDNSSKKKRNGPALRKAPQAPKRFKSSYICFFMAKQSEIKEELGENATIESVSKRSAELWRNLSPEDRVHWNELSAKDKERFKDETETYTGPWKVSSKRRKKDPSAPRRPMSAFLFYSVDKRHELREQNPGMKNTEISRMLGQMWRSLNDEERRPFIEKEKEEREKYTAAMADWRDKKEEETKHLQNKPSFKCPPGVNLPFMYHGGVRLAPSPYPFAANAKQPIILGPSGMPHWKPPVQKSKPVPPPSPVPADPPQFNLAIFDDDVPPDPTFE